MQPGCKVHVVISNDCEYMLIGFDSLMRRRRSFPGKKRLILLRREVLRGPVFKSPYPRFPHV